jgi:hypothetical protein
MQDEGTGEGAKTTMANCNTCVGERHHSIEATVPAADDKDEYGAYYLEHFEIVRCLGCGSMKARRVIQDYYLLDAQGGDDMRYEYLPPAEARRAPEWGHALPEPIRSLSAEIYRALHAQSHRLAAMGTRALLDMAIIDKVGDAGTFAQKLEAFQKGGFIAEKQRSFLEAALDFGHAATHRGLWADPEQVSAALDIVESALQAVYSLDKQAERLRQVTPKRSKPPGRESTGS